MTDKTYNGWSNYETWAVKLWLDNDQGTYYDVTGHASALYAEDAEDTDRVLDDAVYEMADYLQTYVDELQEIILPDMPASVFSDLLRAALSEVNWHEIAESYIQDAKENYTPED